MDLAKFFDTVQLDRLKSRMATRVYDRRVLKLVRSFLTAGVMTFGLVSPSIEETPRAVRFRPEHRWAETLPLHQLPKNLPANGASAAGPIRSHNTRHMKASRSQLLQ